MGIEKYWEELPRDAIQIDNKGILFAIPVAPYCISTKSLVDFFGLTKSTISYHLKKLRKEGKIRSFFLKDFRTQYHQRCEKNDI